MKSLIFLGLVTLCVGGRVPIDPYEHDKVVCFWNSTSIERQGLGKFDINDLDPALPLCTHLIYGYAGINAENHEVVSLHPNLDTGSDYMFYQRVIQLKRSFPRLKVYLSIGGNADPYESTHKYLTVTESSEARKQFVNSVDRLLSNYEFDGIDLAWQFPEVKKKRGTFSSIWHYLKKAFGYGNFEDDKETEHREGFAALVHELKAKLNSKVLTLTVLPHVDASVYYNVSSLALDIDAVHLMAFDQKTPERNPKEADYPAPIYGRYGRNPRENVNSFVRYWLDNGISGSKIVVGIPTFARTWKLTSYSQISGVPPITAEGPGAEGPHTQTPGFLSYAEVCARLNESTVGGVRKVGDPSKKYGSYSYQSYNPETGADGIWIGYEEPDTAGNKAAYARDKGLGGVAIFDLSTDDFRGTCNGDKFPILSAAKYKLRLVV